MFYEEILLNINPNKLKYKYVIFQTKHHRQQLFAKIFNTVFIFTIVTKISIIKCTLFFP